MDNYAILDKAGADYNTIISEQEAAYNLLPGHATFGIRDNVGGTQSLIKLFTESTPTGDTVIATFTNEADLSSYLITNKADWQPGGLEDYEL